MTKELREQIKAILLKLESWYDQWNIDDCGILWWEQCINALAELYEQEITEAERRGSADMLKRIKELQFWLLPNKSFTNKPADGAYNLAIDHCEQKITLFLQSL